MFKTSSEYLPADVLEALRHTRVHTHMLKIPACRYFQYAQAHLCTLEACPKHLQADVLSTFSYFWVKLFAAYHMPTGIPKRLHADVFTFFLVKRLAARHMSGGGALEPSAGRRVWLLFYMAEVHP